MLAIQDLAKQLYSNDATIKSFYFFTGPEYGVKAEYLDMLTTYYKGNVYSYEKLADLISRFKQKSLIPVPDSLYVVRYDKDFITQLSDNLADSLLNLKIPGTIVGIYLDDKDEAKLDKYFPNNTSRINKLSEDISFKHLKNKYDNLVESHIREIVHISVDYYQANTFCQCLSLLDTSTLYSLSKSEIEFLFGYDFQSTSEKFKIAVVSRNFESCIKEIDNHVGDMQLLFYDMLSAYLELAKYVDKKSKFKLLGSTYVYPYLKLWDFKSIKYMYQLTYQQLEKLRNVSTYSPYVSLIYLCGLLQFKLS